MKKSILALFAIAPAVVGAVLAAKPDRPATGAAFKKGPYTLVVTELKAVSELNLAEPKKTSHTVTLAGAVAIPEKLDAVAVRGRLKVLSAVDARERDLLVRTRERPARSYRAGTYVPVNPGTQQAHVELAKTALTANPYTISAMTLETQIVMAKKRTSKRLAAVVMEEPVNIVEGLAVRITAVKLSEKGELMVTAEYSRAASGPGSPFVEAVYAIDQDGKKIGGGRWTQGDPFAKKGKIATKKFKLRGGAGHKSLRFVAVTEDTTETASFKLRKVFRQ